jgi:hypothetical protein
MTAHAPLICALLASARMAAADGPLPIGSYELKFALEAGKAVAADAEGRPALQPSVAKLFGVKRPAKELRVHFLDDCKRTLSERNWIVRIRDKGGEWELTWKKRYPAQPDTEAALARARADGFTVQPGQKVELDMAGERRTLSISIDTELAPPPELAAFADLAASKAPANLGPELGAVVTTALTYGPVRARRFKGQMPDGSEELDIEAWELGASTIVELSAKSANAAAAEALRARLAELVARGGLGAAGETLKAEAVFAATKPATCP